MKSVGFSYEVNGPNISIKSKSRVILKHCSEDFTVGYLFYLQIHDTNFWKIKCHNGTKNPS